MAYLDRITQTPTQLANITDEVTAASAAYMVSNICTYLAEIIGHLERPGFLPRFIFSDDFEAAATPTGTVPAAILGDWRIVAGSGVGAGTQNWAIEPAGADPTNGVLHFDYTGQDANQLEVAIREDQAVFNSQNYELNVTIEVTAVKPAVVDEAIGLVFRWLDSDQFYRLQIDSTGVLLNKSLDAVVNPNVLLDTYTLADPLTGYNAAITLAVGVYNIRVVASFGSWQVWVNGTQTHAATDADPADAWYGEGGVGITFRNVDAEADDYVLISWVDGA